jgi:hypothetical protein
VQATATPDPARVPGEPSLTPAVPEAASTPTIWIWIWNWTWDPAGDGRYRNSQSQFPTDRISIDQNLPRILEKIGAQIPVQIDVQTSADIADEIIREVAAERLPIATPLAAPVPAVYRAPAELTKTKLPPRTKRARGSPSLERSYRTPVEVATISPSSQATADAAPAARHAPHAGKSPRPRRASRPAPSLPLPSERLTDASTASGVSAGIFLKSFAVLIALTLLAAMGGGRRLRLPSSRLRGLLGRRTDPPG